ncbi:MAG: type II toxin-antitoxin system VapC family toxin [Nitrospirota bacterium]
MKPALIDTDILSLFFRNNPNVVSSFAKYLKRHETINFSIITYYEILSGLKHRDASKQLNTFLDFANRNTIIPLTEQSASISSDLYAISRKKGKPIDDIDLLIAGIALANGLALITHNTDHFQDIEGLEIFDWSR